MSLHSLEELYIATLWVQYWQYDIKVSDAERVFSGLIPELPLLELVPCCALNYL